MGGGITTVKTSRKQNTQAIILRNNVKECEQRIIQQQESIKSFVQIKYAKKWSDLVFKLSSFTPKIEVKEITTGQIV